MGYTKCTNDKFDTVCYHLEEAYPILDKLIKDKSQPKALQAKLERLMRCIDGGLNIKNEIQWSLTDCNSSNKGE